MANSWDPDYVVSKEKAKELIEVQFPELAPAKIADLGKGYDKTVYLVNERRVSFHRCATALRCRGNRSLTEALLGSWRLA
ncbi:hypothetical protein [Sporolactobacillus terrae]|uniref:hypothetical protein n=1 Tax=Sporolactobacillus terrae TaxID=269673 RepID=UPI00048E2225|nr:hypothetical protein [Sporolactobacillus terrae]